MINTMNLKGARNLEGAMQLAGLLGFETDAAKSYDLTDLGLKGTAFRIRGANAKHKSYGLVIAEVESLPGSLKSVSRKLIDQFHSFPLAFIGVGKPAAWDRLVILRPKLVKGRSQAITLSRLVVDPVAPTTHDLSVISGLQWDSTRSDTENHQAIDNALDVERVTRQFFRELNSHYQAIVQGVEKLAKEDPSIYSGVDAAGGHERVALRIVTQTLFCYFLQKKGLLEKNPKWLSVQFDNWTKSGEEGSFYADVMESLFYGMLNTPVDERDSSLAGRQVPFLNGGLFERRYGGISLQLPNGLFNTDDGLLGFLDGWNFTVSEERADETEVAVDPEMLGKVFENLMADHDKKSQGAVYTPRPVVQFMCREALVPYLQRKTNIPENHARILIDGDDPFIELAEATSVEHSAEVADAVEEAMTSIQVIDPAVGSGAFPLGMLGEILRLRTYAYVASGNEQPTQETLYGWKVQAIENSLFGVDINPTAIELCRLRLWLALLVDEDENSTPRPLPNLEYRTIAANSLSDFVGGVEVQNTRGSQTIEMGGFDPAELIELRHEYFRTSVPEEKHALRERITEAEDGYLESIFRAANEQDSKVAEKNDIAVLESQFKGRDRVFPVFMPPFHAPEAWGNGGWDVVIMNPPYLERKKIRRLLDATQVHDLEIHYGRTYDLMLLFAQRAQELVCDGGALSMIFNDSIFTSSDAEKFRVQLFGNVEGPLTAHVAARTRCFEGVAVNGGVVVATSGLGPDPEFRWIENFGRPTIDLLGAGRVADPTRHLTPVGESELFEVPDKHYQVLPHRPLFRPSAAALKLLRAFRKTVWWNEFKNLDAPEKIGGGSWHLLSNTPQLKRFIEGAKTTGRFDSLVPGDDFVLLGLVVEGGQGLATADDRHFLAARDGTEAAAEVRQNQEIYSDSLRRKPEAARRFDAELERTGSIESALLAVETDFDPVTDLGWGKTGLIRIAPSDRIHSGGLGDRARREGIADKSHFIPFEKGDSSGADGGASKWTRDNPLVIDWSSSAVSLLNTRAKEGPRKPRIQNRDLWGKDGVTWNRVTSYLRVRRVPTGAIFGDKTPVVVPTVDWLPTEALLAILNSSVAEFIVKTFLGSRMQIEIGDIRRLPIPVLTVTQMQDLCAFSEQAQASMETTGSFDQTDLDNYCRNLYGLDENDELWVTR